MNSKIIICLALLLVVKSTECVRNMHLPDDAVNYIDGLFSGSYEELTPLTMKSFYTKSSITQGVSTPLSYKIHKQTTKVLSAFKELRVSQNLTDEVKQLSYRNYQIRAVYCPKYTPRYFNCDFNNTFRTIDGSCNNMEHPWWGKSETPYARILKPDYDDGVDLPRTRGVNGRRLPNARKISLQVHTTKPSFPNTTQIVPFFGQHVFHDLAFTARSSYSDGTEKHCGCDDYYDSDCFQIPIPYSDYYNRDQDCLPFTRSSAALSNVQCRFSHREQLNEQTHWLDNSNVYGANDRIANSLRTLVNGTLKTDPSVAPHDPQLLSMKNCAYSELSGCKLKGDARTEDNHYLYMFTEIFTNEHNRLANLIRMRFDAEGRAYDDEELYQQARRINIAQYQHIIYNEYLPLVIGSEAMRVWKLNSRYANQYDSSVNPQVKNAFATAAARFGHTLINKFHFTINSSFVPVEKYTTNNVLFTFPLNTPDVTRGALLQNSYFCSPHINEYMNNYLFDGMSKKFRRTSIGALNIQRGRDHGLAGYNQYREWCGLNRAYRFRDFTNIPWWHLKNIRELYDSPDDVDLYTGMMSEMSVVDGVLGHTAACIIGSGFFDWKFGDRFFYEWSSVFNMEDNYQIKNASLARIICDNTNDLNMIQPEALLLPSDYNLPVNCSSLPSVNISALHF